MFPTSNNSVPNKVVYRKHVSVLEHNFSSWPDSPFMLMLSKSFSQVTDKEENVSLLLNLRLLTSQKIMLWIFFFCCWWNGWLAQFWNIKRPSRVLIRVCKCSPTKIMEMEEIEKRLICINKQFAGGSISEAIICEQVKLLYLWNEC